MGFFDRAERERVIDKRMAEVKAAAQKRRAEETDQTGAFNAEYPEEGGVGKALPEDYKTSQTEFNPDDFSFNTDASLQSDKDEEFDPNAVSFNTDPSLQSDRDEVETKKTPEDAAEDDTTEYYDTTFGNYEVPRKDQLRNLAFVGPLLDYMGGSTLEESGLVKGVAESAFAAGEDVFQTVARAKEHLATPEGTRHGRVISRSLSGNPIFQFVRGVSQAADLGKGISDWARGESEEAYGGPAQISEEFNPDDFTFKTPDSRTKVLGEKKPEKGTASAYAYSHDDGTPIGALSQKSESGEDGKPLKLSSTGLGGIDAISFGRGDPGGKSYGRHQFMTRMIKGKDGKLTRTGRYNPADSTMASFLQSKEAKPFSKEILASITDANGKVNWDLLGSDKFDAAWTKVTTGKGRAAWGAAQSNYLGRTHLKPNIDYLNTKYKDNEDIALLLTNKGFLEAIYSGGIQYGATGARKRLILPALLQAEKDNKLGDVAHVIELLYARRKSTGHARPTEKKQVLEMAKS